MNTRKTKAKRSLRTILVIWFLVFSITPLAFVTIYSMYKYKQAIDKEISLRLKADARDISNRILNIKELLLKNSEKISKLLSNESSLGLSNSGHVAKLAKEMNLSVVSIFNRNGQMILSSYVDKKTNYQTYIPQKEAIFLSAKFIEQLSAEERVSIIDYQAKSISLILIFKIYNGVGKMIGYSELIYAIDDHFIQKLKNDLKLDIFAFNDQSEVIISSQKDFFYYKKDFFKKHLYGNSDYFFELIVRDEPFGFVIFPIEWGAGQINFAVGSSKSESREVIKNVNYAFVGVVAIVIFLLTVTILIVSKFVLRPIYDLVNALQSFENQEQAITISFNDDTEVGLLTQSFNEMSQKIWQARYELKKKIAELEKINKELKDTQMKLVHSAKMMSLGQLVAGVAHELNNPIGFIYSNMAHLKDYSKNLIDLIDVAQKKPELLALKKEEYDYNYLVKDMPRLISSCEDGAKRVKDIVLGLRNFSRLDASQLQEVDVHQNIETTLSLLHGEIKNKIHIYRQYGALPLISCYSSQLNQVLMNILSNAIQAIDGAGKIWITTQTLGEDKISISIQDSGQGMSSEILDKIFDPFFTTKAVGQGTGLGLSISYGIIQNHGGEIQVKTQEKVGTEFVIILPIYPPPERLG